MPGNQKRAEAETREALAMLKTAVKRFKEGDAFDAAVPLFQAQRTIAYALESLLTTRSGT